jgi:hypothetical protein
MIDILNVFGRGKIHDTTVIISMLKSNHVAPEDYASTLADILANNDLKMQRERLRDIREQRMNNKRFFNSTKECPDCGERLSLRTINAPKGNANLHGWKSLFFCQVCVYEEYSALDMKEQLQRMGVIK